MKKLTSVHLHMPNEKTSEPSLTLPGRNTPAAPGEQSPTPAPAEQSPTPAEAVATPAAPKATEEAPQQPQQTEKAPEQAEPEQEEPADEMKESFWDKKTNRYIVFALIVVFFALVGIAIALYFYNSSKEEDQLFSNDETLEILRCVVLSENILALHQTRRPRRKWV